VIATEASLGLIPAIIIIGIVLAGCALARAVGHREFRKNHPRYPRTHVHECQIPYDQDEKAEGGDR
jgi:hypothetical protein